MHPRDGTCVLHAYLNSLSAKAKGLARAKLQASSGWANFSAPNYVRPPTILCKKCGCTVYEGRPLASYTELRLVFDDNSAHITQLCRKCAVGLTLKELEAIYCADLVALSEDEEAQGLLMCWELLADRQVVGYERL